MGQQGKKEHLPPGTKYETARVEGRAMRENEKKGNEKVRYAHRRPGRGNRWEPWWTTKEQYRKIQILSCTWRSGEKDEEVERKKEKETGEKEGRPGQEKLTGKKKNKL